VNDFLTDDGGSNNFKASDFVSDYKSPAHQGLVGMMQRLHFKILRLGKSRPRDCAKKFNTADADKLCEWIEAAMARFLSLLSPEYRAHWNEELTHLPKLGVRQALFGPINTTTVPSEVYVTGPFYPPPQKYPGSK